MRSSIRVRRRVTCSYVKVEKGEKMNYIKKTRRGSDVLQLTLGAFGNPVNNAKSSLFLEVSSSSEDQMKKSV